MILKPFPCRNHISFAKDISFWQPNGPNIKALSFKLEVPQRRPVQRNRRSADEPSFRFLERYSDRQAHETGDWQGEGASNPNGQLRRFTLCFRQVVRHFETLRWRATCLLLSLKKKSPFFELNIFYVGRK